MKKNHKKLVLNRETLIHLEHIKSSGASDAPTCSPSLGYCTGSYFCNNTEMCTVTCVEN